LRVAIAQRSTSSFGPCSRTPRALAEDSRVPQRVAARLWPNTDSVRAVADGDSCQHAAVLRADRVHLGVVAPRQPKHFAIGGNASHVGAAADVPFGNEPSGSEIEHRDRSLAPVRDVELLRVPAGIETVCAGARIDEPEHVPTGPVDLP